jgi:hypothetical protein
MVASKPNTAAAHTQQSHPAAKQSDATPAAAWPRWRVVVAGIPFSHVRGTVGPDTVWEREQTVTAPPLPHSTEPNQSESLDVAARPTGLATTSGKQLTANHSPKPVRHLHHAAIRATASLAKYLRRNPIPSQCHYDAHMPASQRHRNTVTPIVQSAPAPEEAAIVLVAMPQPGVVPEGTKRRSVRQAGRPADSADLAVRGRDTKLKKLGLAKELKKWHKQKMIGNKKESTQAQ